MASGWTAPDPGTGLGLAIAAEIAEAFGGRLSLHSPRQGLEARLTLPAVTDPPPG